MGLTVVPNVHAPDVASLLRRICPDPALSIALGTVMVPDPDGGPPVAISLPGTVTYVASASASKSCKRLAALAGSTQTITIEMVDGSVEVDGRAMNTRATVTKESTAHVFNADWGRIEITLDASNANGFGYWVEDASGKHTDLPMDVALAHEMGHAEQFLTSSLSGLSEPLATDAENDYRTERSLPLRSRAHYNGASKAPPPAAPAPVKTSTGFFGNCFIATAALGSPVAPDVVMLRSLRDNILRKTRTGAAFYEWFYDRYYRFSPAVVDMMESDPKVREIVRWIAVTPIVQYLDALVNFPQAPLDDVPEPWRGFLSKMSAGFESFASVVEPPASFEGQTPEDTVTELALLLRYRFRSSETRRRYLSELRDRGALPLIVPDAAQRARLRSEFQVDGADLDPDGLIFSPGVEAASLVAGVFGGNDAITGNPDFMYVFLSNTTGAETVDDVALAYKRSDMSTSVLVDQVPLLPGQSVMFCLGRADRVVEFAFKGFEGNTLVLELSGIPVSDSFIQDHQISPNTFQFFYDGPPII